MRLDSPESNGQDYVLEHLSTAVHIYLRNNDYLHLRTSLS